MSTQMTIDDVDVDYLTERCEIRRERILTKEEADRETQELEAVADERAAISAHEMRVTCGFVGFAAVMLVCVWADLHSKIAALFA